MGLQGLVAQVSWHGSCAALVLPDSMFAVMLPRSSPVRGRRKREAAQQAPLAIFESSKSMVPHFHRSRCPMANLHSLCLHYSVAYQVCVTAATHAAQTISCCRSLRELQAFAEHPPPLSPICVRICPPVPEKLRVEPRSRRHPQRLPKPREQETHIVLRRGLHNRHGGYSGELDIREKK